MKNNLTTNLETQKMALLNLIQSQTKILFHTQLYYM